MATVVIPTTFVAGNTARASEMNANFTAVTEQVNGNLDADNLASGAVTNAKIASGVDAAKLTTGTLPSARVPIYVGSVAGGSVAGTTGWTVSNPSTGNYTITHGLGTSNLAWFVTANNGDINATVPLTVNTNTVGITLYNTAGALANGDFHFIAVNLSW